MPLFALGKLGGNELGRRALHDLLVEALDEFVIELLIAGQESRLEDRGADGHIAARLPDRFIDRAGGVADLQAPVPQAIQNGFRDLPAPAGLLVWEGDT